MSERTDTLTPSAPPEITPGAKMIYIIRRKPTTTREEVVAYWYAHHMPRVIETYGQATEAKPFARHYIVSLFDATKKGEYPWDGMAQLWLDRPLRKPKVPHAITPGDSFQQKVEPYMPWATREYVVMEGSEYLKVEPLTLNAPFPCTRSGFYKVNFLVKAKEAVDFDKFYSHWLNVHIPNVSSVMKKVRGFRYVVSHSIYPQDDYYAGLAELYFHNETDWVKYREIVKEDGMEEWLDGERTLVLKARTEMIGIP